MSSPGMSRKRPAPGASPLVHPHPTAANYASPDSHQLSNDQFLQWGQNVPSNMGAVDHNASHFQSLPHQHHAGLQNVQGHQLARRGGSNQLVSRNRLQDGNMGSMMDHGTGGSVSSGASTRGGQPVDGLGETEEQLHARALAAKKEAQTKRKQIPPFVQKLSSFLDESKNTELIRWSDSGNSFIVLDEEEFAKTLIPELFKHNNYASFVRQLNMYGFHKKVGLSDNSMRASERKNKSPSEYSNPYFRRGHPDLLWLIQKPKSVSGHGSKGSKSGGRAKAPEPETEEGDNEEGGEESVRDRKFQGQLTLSTDSAVAKEHLASVYRELQAIRSQQQIISSTIIRLRHDHEQLSAQAANFQEQHNRHENSINAILTFLATVYNRSLQGHDGIQGLVNSFAGAIPQETTQGNVVDMSDYITNLAGDSSGGQRGFKKQPLLLKAPPTLGPDGHSLSANSLPMRRNQYNVQHGKGKSSGQNPGYQSGNIEELFDQGTPPSAANPSQRQQQEGHSDQTYQQPQRDIMSLIQNSNRNSLPTSQTDFPAVLSSLENAGGNSPLSAAQRADMLRLIANESHPDSSSPASSNNALVTPNPPPMPHGYPNQLANTRAEIDNLIKMQAEQDRSVQNLTNLLQPLSPTGAIPGLDPSGEHPPPPPLDIDSFISSDYFGDFPDGKTGDGTGFNGNGQSLTAANNAANDKSNANIGTTDHNELFDFDSLPDGPVGDFFGDSNANNTQGNHDNSFFNNFDSNFGSSRFGLDGSIDHTKSGSPAQGRVIESFSSSEATSPANTIDSNAHGDVGASASQDQATKRRKRNQ